MITIEQLKELTDRTSALGRYLDIEGKRIQVEEEQLRTQAPGFGTTPKPLSNSSKR
jgi:peptide chain release factor 2